MTKDEMMNELGLMGEKIVINMLNEDGRKVKTSVDKYDSEKEDAPYIKFLKMLQKDFVNVLKEKMSEFK